MYRNKYYVCCTLMAVRIILAVERETNFAVPEFLPSNVCMVGLPISSVTVSKPLRCGLKCLSHPSCLSFNLEQAYDGMYQCELFDKNSVSANLSSDFHIRPSCRYYENPQQKPVQVHNQILSCPAGYSSYGGHCYMLSSVKLSFENARTTCQSDGADLVILETAEESKFLVSLIRQRVYEGSIESSTDKTVGVFLGMMEIPSGSRTWYWTRHGENNKPTSDFWENWSTSGTTLLTSGTSTSTKTDDCAIVWTYTGGNYVWNEVSCATSTWFACELYAQT